MKIWFLLLTILILCKLEAQDRFAFEDADQDWLADSWESTNGLSSSSLADTYADFDNDGLSNIYEFYLGTDPNDVADPVSIELAAEADITDFVEDNWGSITHVKLGAGNFESNVFGFDLENSNLIITGGWNADFSDRDILENESIIDVATGPVFAVWIGGMNNLIIDGLSMTTSNFFGNVISLTPRGGENFVGISNCTFTGPSQALRMLGEDLAKSRLLFTNNLMITSEKYGLECYASNESEIDMRIYHCTIADQEEASFSSGSGIYMASFDSTKVNLDIKNSIIWNNVEQGLDVFSGGESFDIDIEHAVLQTDNKFGGSPISYDLSSENIYQTDPELDENYLPINTSVAIDAGIDLGFDFTGLAPDLGFMETAFSTGIEERFMQKDFQVFPNPVDGERINISMEVDHIQLLDLTGKLILSKSGTVRSFDLPHSIAAGTYFLKLQTDSGIFSKKIMVLR